MKIAFILVALTMTSSLFAQTTMTSPGFREKCLEAGWNVPLCDRLEMKALEAVLKSSWINAAGGVAASDLDPSHFAISFFALSVGTVTGTMSTEQFLKYGEIQNDPNAASVLYMRAAVSNAAGTAVYRRTALVALSEGTNAELNGIAAQLRQSLNTKRMYEMTPTDFYTFRDIEPFKSETNVNLVMESFRQNLEHRAAPCMTLLDVNGIPMSLQLNPAGEIEFIYSGTDLCVSI